MSCGPESRDDTWPHLNNPRESDVEPTGELAVRFDSYHDPRVREYAGLNDQPASHCDGELNPACNKESSKRILEASCRAVEAMRRFASGELFDTPPLKGLTFASDC